MTVIASERHFEDERNGDRSLELVVVTYTGSHSIYNSTSLRTQGQWPSYSPLSRGVPKVAFVPDAGLGYLEAHADLEVEYSDAAVAEALLSKNFIAPSVFGAGTKGTGARKRVLEKLGIERLPTTEEGIREELADIAGIDEDLKEDPLDLTDRLMDPDDGFTRAELKNACEELRTSTSDISLNGKKTDFAQFLAEFVNNGDLTETELFEVVREGD